MRPWTGSASQPVEKAPVVPGQKDTQHAWMSGGLLGDGPDVGEYRDTYRVDASTWHAAVRFQAVSQYEAADVFVALRMPTTKRTPPPT